MADIVRQKEAKLRREKIKESINRWIAQVPDLSTPHYEKDDDLMPSQAYDEIRELAKGRPGCVLRDLQFFENWEIDLRLADLISATEQYIHRDTVGTAPGYAETVICSQKIRDVIETNLPFTVYCQFARNCRVNSSGQRRCSHGIYRMKNCGEFRYYIQGNNELDYVPPIEQNKLLAIIINQQSKIDRLESVLSDMANSTKANELRQQSEINRLESLLSDMNSRLQSIEITQQFAEDKPYVEVDNLIDLPKNPFDDL